MGSRSTQESSVLRSGLEFLATRKDQIHAWRNNNAGVRRTDRSGRSFWTHSGRKGVSDILGILAWTGRFAAFEAKQPAIPAIGQEAGVLTADQSDFLVTVNGHGGVGVCFDDARTLIRVLDDLLQDPYARFDIHGNLMED